MKRDIITDTTVNFIRANERNLQLAFHVEEALPEVRTELIKEFFKCVEIQLKEKVEKTEGWDIRATGSEGLWMCKKSWGRLKVGDCSEDWWGIRLLPEGDGWQHPSISVANLEKTSKKVKEQIRNKFRSSIGEVGTNTWYVWRYLNDDIEDFESFDFLKKMINKEEQGKIVLDMTEELAELAVAVDEVLSNSG